MKQPDKPRRCRFCGWIGRPLRSPKEDNKRMDVTTCECCGNILGVVPKLRKVKKSENQPH